jgi:hypothetical protein
MDIIKEPPEVLILLIQTTKDINSKQYSNYNSIVECLTGKRINLKCKKTNYFLFELFLKSNYLYGIQLEI